MFGQDSALSSSPEDTGGVKPGGCLGTGFSRQKECACSQERGQVRLRSTSRPAWLEQEEQGDRKRRVEVQEA